jgi:hypothetical protein
MFPAPLFLAREAFKGEAMSKGPGHLQKAILALSRTFSVLCGQQR